MTAPTIRPRRSALYIPGSKPRALEKARNLPADVLILDLEDAVTPEAKDSARRNIIDSVRARTFGAREIVIRVNGMETPWGAGDLAAALACGPDAVLVPKVGASADIANIAAMPAGATPPALWAMIETPGGVLNAAAIAGAPRLACLVVGLNDLAADLRATITADRAPLMAALQMTVLAARAHGLAVLDGVHNAFRDLEGLRLECRQGREMGFDGKTLIHPGQIETTNEVFGPTAEELAIARRHLDAFDAAKAEGQGVAVVDGRIVENLHAAAASRLLAMAETIERGKARNGRSVQGDSWPARVYTAKTRKQGDGVAPRKKRETKLWETH